MLFPFPKDAFQEARVFRNGQRPHWYEKADNGVVTTSEGTLFHRSPINYSNHQEISP